MKTKKKTKKIVAKMATQEDLDKGLKIKSRALVDVEWLDACAHMDVDNINPKKLQDFLCPTHTFGKVVAQDENVICIATNVSAANGLDLLAIPIKWVKCINIIGGS